MRVVVTGGRGSLGAAVARAFQNGGHALVSLDHGAEPGTDWLRSIGGVDLTDAAATTRALDAAVGLLGGLDVLVNVAGAFSVARLDGPADAWQRMFAVNLLTCLNACRAALPHLAEGGAIVNVGAAAAAHAGAGMGAYAAGKSAVARLTESLAAELQPRVRVNAVLPRTLDTPANRAAMPGADHSQWTAPAAVADVIVFLASPASRAINGALLPVVNASAA